MWHITCKDIIDLVGLILIPIAIALAPVIFDCITRPRFTLESDIDPSDDSYYIRLKVMNTGKRIARGCIGRLIEIRNEKGDILNIPQLNFCWERHNQAFPPHPIDIPKQPYAKYLDIAKHSDNSERILFRVDCENQQLPKLTYDNNLRQLDYKAKSFFILVSVFTSDGIEVSKWIKLNLENGTYQILFENPIIIRGSTPPVY